MRNTIEDTRISAHGLSKPQHGLVSSGTRDIHLRKRRQTALILSIALLVYAIAIPRSPAQTAAPSMPGTTADSRLSPEQMAQLRAETTAAVRAAIVASRSRPIAMGRLVGRTSTMNEQTQLAIDLKAMFGSAPADIFGPSNGDIVSSGFPRRVPGATLYSEFARADYGFLMDKVVLPDGMLIYTRVNRGVATIVVPAGSGAAAIQAAATLTNLCPIGGESERFRTGHGKQFFQLHLRCQIDYTLVVFYPASATIESNLDRDIQRWALAYIRTIREVGGKPLRSRVLRTYVKVLGR